MMLRFSCKQSILSLYDWIFSNFIINIYKLKVFFYINLSFESHNLHKNNIMFSIYWNSYIQNYCCRIYTGENLGNKSYGIFGWLWQRQCLFMNQPSCNDVSDKHFKVVNNQQLDMINLWSALKQCYTIIFTCKVIFNHFFKVQNLGLNWQFNFGENNRYAMYYLNSLSYTLSF